MHEEMVSEKSEIAHHECSVCSMGLYYSLTGGENGNFDADLFLYQWVA